MDPNSIISIVQGLLFFVVLLVFVNLYLVVRLKDIDPFKSWNRNLLNAGLFMVFFVSGVVLAGASMVKWYPKMILLQNPASQHGVALDDMMWNTIWVTFLVVLLTNSLLFWFAWKYRGVEGRKGLYYPHNNRLELIWTAVPAVVMAILVIKGAFVWDDIMMGDPKENEISIEVTGKQFDWTYRYPGADGQFGETKVGFIKPGLNEVGFNKNDKYAFDDVVLAITDTVYFPVNTSIDLQIRARDVLHSATFAHFRVKMDAVPGMPTSFRFTPSVTTKDMKKITGNEDFNYEMSCQQICGGGHYNMRRVIKVVEKDEYDAWLSSKTSYFKQNAVALGLTEKDFQDVAAAFAAEAETLSMKQ
ncbi:MAG: cytochrome c oxidase subunit II [Bacteroidota bacterium]